VLEERTIGQVFAAVVLVDLGYLSHYSVEARASEIEKCSSTILVETGEKDPTSAPTNHEFISVSI
jgi:hypothetical protein